MWQKINLQRLKMIIKKLYEKLLLLVLSEKNSCKMLLFLEKICDIKKILIHF